MTCLYPNLTQASAYRNGCRCEACRNDKRASRTNEPRPKRRTGKTGREIEQAYYAKLVAERAHQVITIRCAVPDCCYELTGPMGEVSGAHLQHRLEQHPEIKPKPRRMHATGRIGGIVTKQSLDDNVQNARAQGAATWL